MEHEKKIKIFNITRWAGKFSREIVDKVQYNSEQNVRECKCGNIYIVPSSGYPSKRWDRLDESIKNSLKNNPMLYYGDIDKYQSDYMECECGCEFKDMQLVYPVVDESYNCTLIRTYTEPELDPDYVNLPKGHPRTKKWHELEGGIQEWQDIHGKKFEREGTGLKLTV